MNKLKTKLKQLAVAAFAAVLGFVANADGVTTVTWDSEEIQGEFSSGEYRSSYQDIDITSPITLSPSGEVSIRPTGYGSFTTTLGNFTKIEVAGGFWGNNFPSGEGWSNGTWTGNASEVPFSGYLTDEYGSSPFSITFTIGPTAPALDPVDYIAASVDEGTHEVTFTNKTCEAYEVVTESTTAFESNKWYVVSGDVTNANRIVVSGTAHLILTDGKIITRIFCSSEMTILER